MILASEIIAEGNLTLTHIHEAVSIFTHIVMLARCTINTVFHIRVTKAGVILCYTCDCVPVSSTSEIKLIFIFASRICVAYRLMMIFCLIVLRILNFFSDCRSAREKILKRSHFKVESFGILSAMFCCYRFLF